MLSGARIEDLFAKCIVNPCFRAGSVVRSGSRGSDPLALEAGVALGELLDGWVVVRNP